ncbi:hypothetical protein MIND_00103700 [Mycena indigotica]|uniref:UV-endonuclease UvdE n=1 Tax=Mycena indigotica TaxID=2126181 RepID=A0A8H6WFK7_9AGAR|nr:uncharacterized protein MIND_00103700 [Mycena indigotica]KAF7315872.1 hypothetical protein MIND_00103700 [Mycena indigotica]
MLLSLRLTTISRVMSVPLRRSTRSQVQKPSDDVPLPTLTPKKRKRKDEVEGEDEGASPPKRAARKQRVDQVYVIPDVMRKETNFKGRLGYACLNTILRNQKPAKTAVFCSRTCRIDSIKANGIDWVKDLGRKNLEDLLTMIQWNEDNNIRFMRMSSEMFPFASHNIYGYSLEYCAPLLARVGELANSFGHRLTTHPGQFTQLGSPKPEVVQASVRELVYHCEMMDKMGLGVDSVMIIHGGGTYGDKAAALERLKKTVTETLPANVRARLVLENDELCYNVDDLLPLCEELDIPLVFDYHHDNLFPSTIPRTEIFSRINALFVRRGIKPKQHLSEPRPGAVTIQERRAHSDRCETLPVDLPEDMDLMIEAKDKEQAVFHLYRIYGLQPVKQENLRPPVKHQTTETKGRKSNKNPRKKKGVNADSEVESGQDD